MKKYLILFVLCVLTINLKAQYTELPSYEKKKPWSTDVQFIGIGASDDDVTITLAISGGYNFNSQTYLEFTNPANGNVERVYMKDSWRETGQYAMKFASMGYHSLSLVFPPLPSGVNKINLISDKPKVYGISIRPVVRTPKPETKRLVNNEVEVMEMIERSDVEIAGLYEGTNGVNYKLAVVNDNDKVYVLYVSEKNSNDGTWACGEVKASLRATAVPNVYTADWYMRNKRIEQAVVTFNDVSMAIEINQSEPTVYIKMGENNKKATTETTQKDLWTGTGYAIGNGYIATNYHVAGEAKTISVKGIKGDMNTGYTAEMVASDKTNDIAILRITDPNFKGFGTIPYAVQQRMADVGEDVFVLGYPLTQALGNEIKLTNGIVSSRTGFQGDISTYQMSAPVQPGNSGGPMFDSKGNVIGIVVAGVPGAENVGYAIKTSYLKILIESAGLNITFPANNTIATLSLAEKVKRVKNFVFYIECSNK